MKKSMSRFLLVALMISLPIQANSAGEKVGRLNTLMNQVKKGYSSLISCLKNDDECKNSHYAFIGDLAFLASFIGSYYVSSLSSWNSLVAKFKALEGQASNENIRLAAIKEQKDLQWLETMQDYFDELGKAGDLFNMAVSYTKDKNAAMQALKDYQRVLGLIKKMQ